MAGTIVSRDEFTVTACSTPGSLSTTPTVTTLVGTDFVGDRTELGPLPSSISLIYESDVYKFNIISNDGSKSIKFTITYGEFSNPTISDENSGDYIQIQPTNAEFSSNLGTTICESLKDRTIIKSILLRALVFKTIPGFILAEDLYTIDIVIIANPDGTDAKQLFINVKIGRPKSHKQIMS